MVIAGLAATAVWMPALLVAHGIGWRELSSYGLYPDDQFQYFSWIRDMAGHGLATNLWDAPRSTPHDFLHPGFLASSLAYRAGVPIPVTYGLWVPVALVVLWASARAYVARLVDGAFARAAAVAIGLLAFSPLVPAVNWLRGQRGGNLRLGSLDAWNGGLLSGYPLSAIAVALLPLALLRLERWRAGGGRAQLAWAGVAAAVAGWLHPWQGQILALTVVIVEARLLVRTRRRPPVTGLAVFISAAIVPVLYYAALAKFDPAWALARRNSTLALTPHFFWLAAGMVLPLFVLAVPGYRARTDDWQQIAVRAWPVAAVIILVEPAAGYRLHSLEGVAIPLGILSATMARTLSGRRVLGAAVVVLCIVGPLVFADVAAFRSRARDYYVNRDEGRALATLAHDARPGFVLAPTAGFGAPSAWVAYRTGREVVAGNGVWSPAQNRVAVNEAYGRGSSRAAMALARKLGARFVVFDCRFSAAGANAVGCVRVLRRF